MNGRGVLRGIAPACQRFYPLLLAAGLVGVLYLVARDPLIDAEAVMVAGSPGAPDSAALHALTTGPHMDGFGSWSPDGSRLAFMRDGRIWVAAADGSSARPVSSGGPAGWDVSPVWRPDGRQIAFARLGDSSALVMSVDPTTTGETILVTEDEPVGYLAWAPRGESLWYTKAHTLMRLDLASSRRSVVLSVGQAQELLAGGLTISRDGRTIIVGIGDRRNQSVAYDLWTLDLSRSAPEPQRLTREGGIMPALDAKGRRLVYRNSRRAQGIYLMELASHRTHRVLSDASGTMYFHPAFTPDGKRLVVSRLQLGTVGQGRELRLVSHLFTLPVGDGGRN